MNDSEQFMHHELATISALVAQLRPPAEILAAFPERLKRSDLMAEGEKQLARIEADLVGLEGYRDEPDGLAHRVVRLFDRRRDMLKYLGRPEAAEVAQAHRANVTLKVRCLTSTAGQLAALVNRAEQRRQEHRLRLGSAYPPAFLASTLARYEAALARSAEVHQAIGRALSGLAVPLREFWLAGHPDAGRYVTLRRELATSEILAQFIGSDGATGKDVLALRSRADDLVAHAQAEVDARIGHVRTRVYQGEPDGLTAVLSTIEDHPDRFPEGAARGLRLAVYAAAAGVDALVFAGLDTSWPEADPTPTPAAAPVNAWAGEGPSRPANHARI